MRATRDYKGTGANEVTRAQRCSTRCQGAIDRHKRISQRGGVARRRFLVKSTFSHGKLRKFDVEQGKMGFQE